MRQMRHNRILWQTILILLATISITSASTATEEQSLAGTLFKSDTGDFFIRPFEQEFPYHLIPSNETTAKQLRDLVSFDFLTGTATMTDLGDLLLQDVEFVGLSRLLGAWRNETSSVNFLSYSDVMAKNFGGVTGTNKYAIGPLVGSRYKFFFTHDNQVDLYNLEIRDDLLIFQLDGSSQAPTVLHRK